MRAVLLALVLLAGCASARVEARDGTVYRAFALGQGHASAGRCDRVASDVSTSTKDAEHRESKDDERGQLCAVANGGRGSPGAWATIAGAFAALFAMLAL